MSSFEWSSLRQMRNSKGLQLFIETLNATEGPNKGVGRIKIPLNSFCAVFADAQDHLLKHGAGWPLICGQEENLCIESMLLEKPTT